MPNPNGQNSVETLKRPTSTEITNNKRQKNELTVPQNSNDPLSSASTYSSSVSAVKNTLHGILDQVKLSILVLKEAIDKNYNFQLSTEMDAADKFDDIVLERQISSTQVESSCFQIKHHLKNKKIALAELFTPLENIDTTYSLQKYFFYYLKMKENEYFKNKVIRLFIMTTSSLDEDHLRKHLIRLKQTINPDFLASVNIENKIKSYQFELEDFDKNKLGQLLKSGSEFYQLARYLAAEVNSQLKINKNIKNYLFRKYNKALYTENIIDSKTNELHTSFFNNNLSPNIEEFKKLFIEYTNVDINTIKKNKFILPSVTNESKNQFPNQPNENDINDFLTKLIFCSDLPSEDSLDLPLQTYLGEYFSFIDSEFIADHIQSKMLNWLKTKGPKGQEGHYLTRVTGQDFLYEIQQHIDKLVLIGPTLEYKEKLNSGEIDFIGFLKNEKPYIDFLNDKSKKVLHIIAQKETFFSAIKVYKNLEKHFSNDRKEDNYLFLRFSTAKRMQEKLINSFSSDRSFQLLVIECKKEVAFSELSILLNLLAEVLKRPNKQLILISRGEFEKKTIETALKSSVNEYKDIINFFELTFKSKEKLLHKSVNFQGNQFFLKELIINSFFNRNFPFEYFSKENRLSAIKIGSKITLPKNYKEKTYIYRKIIQSNQFDLKILKDTNTDKFFITGINKKKLAHFVRNTKLIASVADSLQDRNLDFKFIYDDENKAYAKEKFEKIYKQLNKIENSIHWLEYQATTKKLIWKSSQGNLVNLKRYGRENTILSEKECFTSIEQKLVILSASTGMGKSFFLASIASQIKTKNPALWVSVINLKAHIKAIESLDFSKENHVEENVKNFLKQILHIKTVFENYHFEYNFENAGLVLLFEHYESLTQIQIEKFFKLIDRLTVLNLKQIWITAKPEFLSSLEERFSSLSLQLSPLTGNEQKKLINDIWINNRALHENDKVKFDSLAANFLARVKNSIVEPKHEHSLTKPITLSLLASIMKNSFENLDKLDTSISKINEYSIFQIYRKFIIENFRKALVGLSNNKSILDDLENHAKNYLAQAAREFLFPHILRENRKIPEVVKLLTFIDVNENKIDFSHQTFAEYFYVQWLLFNKNAPNDEIKEVLEKKRSFSSFFYQFFNEQFSEGNPVSFFAVTKNKEELNLELNKINKIFFDVADSSGRTALHLVAANGDVDKFHIFYQWGMDFNKRDIQLNLTPIEHAALEKQWKFLNTVILDIKDRIEYKAKLFILDQLNQEKEPIFCFLTREHFSNLALWVWESKENFQSEINQVNFEGDTALHIAARYGYLDMVDFLLTHQANFKLRNHDNYTPMDEAVSESQLSVIKKLYETGASLVPTDYQQNVPSILAIEENAIEIINYFFSKNIPVVKNQANEISYDSQGETALHAICSVGDKALFELILSYPETDQTYINYANYKGQSALHFAAKYDQYDFLKQLSAKRGNIFLKDKNEKVPLHYLDFSKQETFIFIKSLSVEINEQLKDETNNSLLHFAAEAGNLDLVRYLVEEKKFIIYLVNDRGYSPLSTAVVERQTLVVDYLVNKIDMEKKWDKFIREDGDIFSFLQDENGNTLAHLAVIYDQPLLLQKLVEKQPTIVRLRNNNLENLFDLAVTFGKKALVSNLIKLNNDIIHGYEENTPLYIACREGHLDIVKLLVESGVDINKPGFMKNSPLMGAVKAKSISVIDYLLTRNPDVQKTNILGESFFSLLKKTGDPFLIEKFITKFLSLPLAQIGLEDTSTLSEHWPAFSANFRQMMCSLLPQPRNKRATNCEKIKENERWYRPLTPLATEWPGESAHFFSLLSLAFGIVFPNEFKVENQIYDKSHWLAYQIKLNNLLQQNTEKYRLKDALFFRKYNQLSYNFFKSYPKKYFVNEIKNKDWSSSNTDDNCVFLFEQDEIKLIVFRQSFHFYIYSAYLNYHNFIMLDVDTSLTSLLEHIKQFYLWNKGYVNFRIFSPKKNLAGTLKEALIQQSLVLWQPFEKHIEQHGLNKYSNEVERIPNELILKLIRVFGKKPILTQLTKDFFYQYRDGITCRYGVLHRYLASITPTQKKAILDTIKKYRWPVDINDHEKLTQQESHLLNTYEKKVRTELLELEELSLEHLSQLSWEVIRHEIKQLSYIDEPELAEKTIGHLREVHQQWTTRFKQHIKGGIGQSLFFLPDIIRALNNHAEGLISNVGLLASDTLLNKMSHNLIDKLPLNVKRSNLLKRITPNNPLFKVITLYSIFELQHQLKNQAVDSQTYQTIQHHLLEQYTAVGLIAAELFGFEVAPLWIALMIEQFLYSAIEFRKIYHLHISFFKALMMDLGFYRKEFNQIMNERSLLLQSTQLFLQKNSTMSTFFKWLIIRIPEIPSSKYLNIPDESVPLPLKDYLQKQTANVQSCAEDAQAQTLGYRLTSFYKVEKKYPIGKPAYVCEHQLTQNHWERKIYTTLVKNSTIHFNPVKIIHHEENNIFLENIPEETSLLKLISSVDSPTGIISIHPVLLITGGLSALYENHGNVSQENRRNMYLFFDPREGDLNLAFTWQGLKSLGPTNSTDPFLLVVQVDHKTYEEQLIFEAKTYRLNLKDDSMRLQTHYLINTRINFHITDNTSQSEFSFYPYCHNQAENCRVKTLISSDKAIINVTHVGNEFALLPRAQQIFLKKNKNYFTINLNSNFISNPFILFANQTKLLGAKGLGLEKSVIFAQNTKNLEMEDIKGNFTLLDSFSKLMIEGMIVNENTLFYRRYHLDQSTIYLFSVKDFNIVLATLALDIEKINASLAIVFNYSDAWIRWQHNNSASFILELQGPINTNWGSLRFSKEGCILKILNRENKLLQQQNFYFKSSLLSLNTSLPLTGFYYLQKEYSINSSHYFSYRGLNEDATLAQNFSPPARFIAGKSIFNLFRDKSLHKEIIFEFKSEGAPIFYHFLKNQAKFNGIMYRVYKNRLVAQPINNAMDGRNLLFFQTEEGIQSIPVFLNQSFIKTSAKYNEQHNSLSFDDLKFYYLTKTVFLQFNDTDQYISVNLIQDRLCLPIRQQAYKSTRYSLETNDRATLANQSNSQATRLQTQDVSLSNFSHIENTTVFYAYYAHSNLHVDGRQFIKSKVLTRKKVIKEHWLSQINSFFIGTAFATVSLISGAFFIFKKRFKRPAVPVVSPLAIPLLEVSGASALTEEVNQDNYFASNSNNSYCFKLLRVIENIKDIPTNNNSNYSPSSATYTSNLNTQLVFFNYLSHSIKKNFEKDKSNKLKKERAHITADNFHPCLPAKEENTAISNLNDIKCQAVNKTFRLF